MRVRGSFYLVKSGGFGAMQAPPKPRSKKGDSELEVLNGVRFLSCVFIILGNVFLFTLKSPLQNLDVL